MTVELHSGTTIASENAVRGGIGYDLTIRVTKRSLSLSTRCVSMRFGGTSIHDRMPTVACPHGESPARSRWVNVQIPAVGDGDCETLRCGGVRFAASGSEVDSIIRRIG